ncbi:hypothetical protein G9464_02140 [Halostella sp. JP-L12]|uniref:DUF7504 family protein n=1 Tax=Halostella TaxID=1843185 RepID=UPI000EF7C180|nr:MULTISPECIES: hypothetical protein [Halostella]NHN46402.1 hypothetical protein [Halostella sp. JP-L12]
MTDPLASLDDASSILFLTPSLGDATNDTCIRLLDPTEPAATNVLFVTFTGSPRDRLEAWIDRAGGRPATAHVVTAGETAGRSDGDGPAPDSVERVGTPSDLTGISIRVSEVLSEWSDTDANSVVCFDSITALLQYVDVETAYEFLHVLTGRLYAFGAKGHFHLDPGAHPDMTVARIQTLFDAMVEADGDDLAVRRQ